jgi:hypothetical protein
MLPRDHFVSRILIWDVFKLSESAIALITGDVLEFDLIVQLLYVRKGEVFNNGK